MKRSIRIFLILLIGGIIGFFLIKNQTKSHSPEETVHYRTGNLKVEVFYNRPAKRGREIFGELVPFNQVWRTGANEATTFSVNQAVQVDGSLLEAGRYTLWTIPQPDSWKIIFNKKMYAWGIDLSTQEAARDEAYDALIIEVPTQKLPETVERFSIHFEKQNHLNYMVLSWDQTQVSFAFDKLNKKA